MKNETRPIRTATFRFAKQSWEAIRNAVVLNLRKDGFYAVREYDRENNNELLITNASFGQISMACGRGGMVHF